jgi:hypothetical protein
MSFIIINGRELEVLDSHPDFFEPKPVSPKNKKNILFAQANGTIHLLEEEVLPSVLGKRKFVDTFGDNYSDKERYGQTIGTDFFTTNIGHGVYQKVEDSSWELYLKEQGKREKTSFEPEEILNWCYKYLEKKNK